MAIDFYTGVPGSGKSYHAAQRIYHAIRSGKTVIRQTYDETENDKAIVNGLIIL